MQLMLQVDGVTAINRTLTRWRGRLADASPAFDEIGGLFAQIETRRFAQQGPGWAPLSPAYARAKAALFPGRPILVRTGQLRDSLTQRPFGIDRVGPTFAEFGTNIPYAQYHQHGTPHMPARPPLVTDLAETDKRRMTKIMQRYIVGLDREGML